MLKMAKCPLLISLMVLLVLVGVSLLTVSVHGAPASSDGAHLSIIRSVEEGDSEKDLTTFMSLPSPPPAPKEERDVSHNTPFKINLPFIKVCYCIGLCMNLSLQAYKNKSMQKHTHALSLHSISLLAEFSMQTAQSRWHY